MIGERTAKWSRFLLSHLSNQRDSRLSFDTRGEEPMYSESDIALKISNVSKSYGEQQVLQKIDLEVKIRNFLFCWVRLDVEKQPY